MKCTHCGCEHPDNYRFCPQTGKTIPLPMIACSNPVCPEYGKQIIEPESAFCPFCGQKLNIRKLEDSIIDDNKESRKEEVHSTTPIISEYKYSTIYHGPRGLFIVETVREKWGVIDEYFNEIIPCIYDDLSCMDYDDNYIVFSKYGRDEADEKFGVLNFAGNIVIPPIYETASVIEGQNAFVLKNSSGYYGVINAQGKVIIPFEWEWISPHYNCGLLAVSKGRKKGFVNLNGNIVIPLMYEDVGGFNEHGLTHAKKDGYWGVIDGNNNTILPFDYDCIRFSWYGCAILVQYEDAWSVLDYEGNLLSDLPDEHDNADIISPQLVRVSDDSERKECRFYRVDLHDYLPTTYLSYDREGFYQDNMYIRVGEGYYDEDEAEYVRDCPDYLMDINGEIVYEDEDGYDVTETPSHLDGLFRVSYEDEGIRMYAVVDLSGKCILPSVFTDIYLGYDEQTIVAIFEGKPCVFDRQGSLLYSNGIDHDLLFSHIQKVRDLQDE